MDALVISQTFSPGSSGLVVKRIQEWLTLNGLPVPISSTFDQATTVAVSQFRQQRALGSGSTVDPTVYAALVDPMIRAIAPIAQTNDFAEAVLAVAEQQLAASPLEVGGPNRGPWVRLYMNGHEGPDQLWCAGFVTFCLKQAAIARQEPTPIGGSIACDDLATQAAAIGALRKGFDTQLELRPGNLFLIPKQNRPTDWFHTGIVRSVGATTFETIEGNTSGSNQANGDRVMSRQRSIADCDFVVF